MKSHYKYISPLLIGFFLLCTACHNNDQALEEDLTTSLDQNNEFIMTQLRMRFNDIQNKDADPANHEDVVLWNPRVKAIHKLSGGLCDYIDSIKASPELQTRQSLDTLLAKVEHYRKGIADIFLNDSFPAQNIRDDFEKDMRRFNVALPVARTARTGTVATTALPVVCNKIKNDVLLSEYYLIDYLYKLINVDRIFRYDRYVPLIHQNYSHLKNGQRLIITAGIGAYSSATKKVTIDGRQFSLNAEGYIQYSIIPKGSSGKHTIPVRIEYIRPDRTADSYTQNIEYEITP